MFKFTGLILLSASVFLTFNKNLIISYFTYVFINEAVSILEKMKTGCILGKTYTSVFSGIDYSEYYFFIYGQRYRCKNCLFEQRTKTVDRIFLQSGQRGKADEIEFLTTNINVLNAMSDKYKSYLDTNRKTYLLSSVSVILIISIVII